MNKYLAVILFLVIGCHQVVEQKILCVNVIDSTVKVKGVRVVVERQLAMGDVMSGKILKTYAYLDSGGSIILVNQHGDTLIVEPEKK